MNFIKQNIKDEMYLLKAIMNKANGYNWTSSANFIVPMADIHLVLYRYTEGSDTTGGGTLGK
ncbi:hypothetical protein [Bacillus xiapuensis]|uniref:hypothetical protein n=1 Tax=Bacillus xiapuensis TaxID=2014075 RepID=UPI001E5FC003|nr:hypothetical protein [Bacillus xiapuensis]